jgi:hypothetical protein
LSSKKADIYVFFDLLVEFIKRIKMKKRIDEKIKNKIYEIDVTEETNQIIAFIFE